MSTSASPGKAFYSAFALLVAVLVLGIVVLALLVSTSGPRVRSVVVQNEGADGAGIVGQRLTVFFDRPISTSDAGAAVEIRPKSKYTVTRRGQQIGVTFDQNLLSDTGYSLSVGPGLRDSTGTRMAREYSYEFDTAKPSFTYLKRDYGPGTLDEVIERTPLSGEQRTLFEDDRISRFARNGDYLAAVIPHEIGDELRVVPTGPGQSETVEFPPGTRISDLEFSPTDDQFVFLTVASGGSEQDSGRLYRYDIGGGRTRPVELPEGEDGFSDALYSRDGQALLYRMLDGSFYLTGATRETELIPLGEYEASGGFDRTNARISFKADTGSVSVYDAVERRMLDLPLVGAGMVISPPTFLHNSDALIYRQDFVDRQAGVTLSEVDVAYSDGRVEKQITALYPVTFFDAPVVSHDDRYVLVESTLDRSKGDGYPGNEQPKDAYLSLYDRTRGTVVEEIRGVDPVWSP